MTTKTLGLHEPSFTELDEKYVLETLRSSWVSTGGPFVDRFERDIASFAGFSHGISVSNGTLGLQLALEVVRRQQEIATGFEVIVPTLTFIATANSVVHAGGTPVFVDCAEGKLNTDANAILGVIERNYVRKGNTFWNKNTERPLLAVMPAHLMGWAVNLAELAPQLKEMGIPLVEDAAEALGCFRESDGKHVGHDGIASVLSFNGNKVLTTGGGGIILTNDAAFAKRAKHLSTTAKVDGLRYVHDEVGYNFRLVNVLAAMGCSQLEQLPERLEKKKSIRNWYFKHLEASAARLYEEQGMRSNHWLINVTLPIESAKEACLKTLNSQSILSRPLWTPLHIDSPFSREAAATREVFPNAETIWKRTLSLPSSPSLTEEDVARVCSALQDALHSKSRESNEIRP